MAPRAAGRAHDGAFPGRCGNRGRMGVPWIRVDALVVAHLLAVVLLRAVFRRALVQISWCPPLDAAAVGVLHRALRGRSAVCGAASGDSRLGSAVCGACRDFVPCLVGAQGAFAMVERRGGVGLLPDADADVLLWRRYA